MSNKIYKTVDLFSGIGGIRRGFEMTGFYQNVLSAEIDKFACLTYEHLFKDNPCNDVSSNEFKYKINYTKYDILLAGFPCQSFSIAGEKLGFADKTRGTLFFEIAEILSNSKPKAFLLENVEGLFTHDKGNTFQIIINTLVKELNYHVIGVSKDIFGNLIYNADSFLRKTSDFGLPQKRVRTYIVGFNQDIIPNNFNFSKLPMTNNKTIFKNLYDLLEEDVLPKYYLSEQYFDTLIKHQERHSNKGNGFGFKVVNQGKEPLANTILATGGSGKERNLIVQHKPEIYGLLFGDKRSPINNKGIRVMTPIEWARLQGFKDYAFLQDNKDYFSFPKTVSETQQYKQLGNSVSIPVIEAIAKNIYTTL